MLPNRGAASCYNFLIFIPMNQLRVRQMSLYPGKADVNKKRMRNTVLSYMKRLLVTKLCLYSRSVFFNLGSEEPTGSANSLQGSARILKLALFLVSRFRQKFNNVSKVPRLEKG